MRWAIKLRIYHDFETIVGSLIGAIAGTIIFLTPMVIIMIVWDNIRGNK
jgi:hypothetical protein